MPAVGILIGLVTLVILARGQAAPPATRPDPGQATWVLRQFEQAIADGDPAAAARLAPDSDARAGEQVAAIARNAQALRDQGSEVRDLTLRYLRTSAVAADGSWTAAVTATWRFAGFDPVSARAVITVRFRPEPDRLAVQGIVAGPGTPVWLAGPVAVRQTRHSLVLVAGTDQATADRYARRADAAGQVVTRVLPRWRPRIVVEVPASSQQLEQVLAGAPGSYASIAAVSASVGDPGAVEAPVHVFVNPDLFDRLPDRGAQVVLSHEATHLAVGATRSSLPLWLVEGFADYVALRDVELPLSRSAGELLDQVRQAGPPDSLPTDADFATQGQALTVAYQAAWLACRVLVEQRDEQALVRLYRQADRAGSLDQALRVGFAEDQAGLTARWQTRLTQWAR